VKQTIVLTDGAQQEIINAFNYYESAQAGIGAMFINYLESTFNSISTNPKGFKKISSKSRQAVVRKFPFIVIYEAIDDQIVILAVFHTSRKPKRKSNKK
jgi:plasmid stabilization system protein ParE